MDLIPIKRIAAVLLVSFLMTWPAIYNGFPLLYPDSMSYLESGPYIARGLFMHDFPTTYSVRGSLYGLSIWPLHWNSTAWPIVWLNALVIGYVLWLVVRSLRPQWVLPAYLALAVPLSLLTGVPWYVGFLMPDILGPVVYLSFYLIAFAPQSLSRVERLLIALMACWAITAHPTHLLLTGGLCALVPLVLRLQRQPPRRCIAAAGWLVAITLVAALAQLGLHWRLYDEVSLNGKRTPFLLARVIADGPGRRYLQQHCQEQHPPAFFICQHVDKLPDNVADFLWARDGIWRGASAEQQDELRREEMPIVLATIRAYPWAELSISAAHFWRQLNTFGLYNYTPNPWILEMFATVLPGARAHYVQSRQARQLLPVTFFSVMQNWTVRASILVITIAGLCWRPRWPRNLAGLAAMIFFVVIANAAVTGALSNVEDRYQGRVIWLVPLLAGLILAAWPDRRPKPGAAEHRAGNLVL